jgi:hypothetical protein
MTDRLALAIRTRKARRRGTCHACTAPIQIGQQIAKMTAPTRWIHVACVPVVRRALERKMTP